MYFIGSDENGFMRCAQLEINIIATSTRLICYLAPILSEGKIAIIIINNTLFGMNGDK
jgi:hypothetical protein